MRFKSFSTPPAPASASAASLSAGAPIEDAPSAPPGLINRIAPKVLGAISLSHFLNDMTQSLILAIYPLLKGEFNLSFTQIGAITLTYQFTASVLQPLVGLYTDRRPQPYSLVAGMGCTLVGLAAMAYAPTYHFLLAAAAMVGAGSSVFHPESSRVARMASGGRYGLAQSVFQVGGNGGSAVGPLLAAWIILPRGRGSMVWFSLAVLLAIALLWQVGGWFKKRQALIRSMPASRAAKREGPPVPIVARAMVVLLVLIFSKFFYMASMTSYYTFFLMHKFQFSVQSAQIHLFIFLFAVAVGTLAGGPIGDRIGRKKVIWASILGVAPFTLMLPYASAAWTGPLTFVIGLVLSSAFSAILVFAQELVPGKVGMVAGLFFGLAFGMAGIGAAVLGRLADAYGIEYVYWMCSFLPLLGIFTAFLPDVEKRVKA